LLGPSGKKRIFKNPKIYSERLLRKGYSSKSRVPVRGTSLKIQPGERLKEARPQRKFPWKLFFGLFLGLGIFYWLFLSNYFQIKNVEITGNESLDQAEIIKRLPLFKNIFLTNLSLVEQKLKQDFPEIAEVVIYKGLPSVLKVLILERKPQIAWQTGGEIYLVDREGVCYKKVSLSELSGLVLVRDLLDLPVTLGQKIVPAGFVEFLTNANQLLNERGQIRIHQALLKGNTFDLDLLLDRNIHLYLDPLREVEPQVETFIKIITEKGDLIHEYVDVRIPGLAYLK